MIKPGTKVDIRAMGNVCNKRLSYSDDLVRVETNGRPAGVLVPKEWLQERTPVVEDRGPVPLTEMGTRDRAATVEEIRDEHDAPIWEPFAGWFECYAHSDLVQGDMCCIDGKHFMAGNNIKKGDLIHPSGNTIWKTQLATIEEDDEGVPMGYPTFQCKPEGKTIEEILLAAVKEAYMVAKKDASATYIEGVLWLAMELIKEGE